MYRKVELSERNLMKTLKVMSIVSLVLTVLAMACMVAWQDSDPASAVGWGFILAIWSIAFSITVLVTSVTHKIGDK